MLDRSFIAAEPSLISLLIIKYYPPPLPQNFKPPTDTAITKNHQKRSLWIFAYNL